MSSNSDGLSTEEFLRLQEQLIELRNSNYELKEKLKRVTVPDGDNHSTKKDALQFASRLLNRNQPDKDKLEAEVDSLRAKLQQQEEEFRLQQKTFIEELNKMAKTNEAMQKEKDGERCAENDQKQLEKEQQLESQVTSLEEILRSEKDNVSRLSEELGIQTGVVKGFEDAVLNLRHENGELERKIEQSTIDCHHEVAKLKNEMSLLKEQNFSLQERLLKREEEISQREQQLDAYKEKDGQIDKMKLRLLDNEKETDSLRHSLAQETEQKEHLQGQLKELRACQESELVQQKTDDKEHFQRLESKIIEERNIALLECERVLAEKQLYCETKLSFLKDSFEKEKTQLTNRISRLTSELEAKEEEKLLALKKQNFVIKELQKAVKEERRRADSVEKLKERDWHVVESDARSNLTFDGNESVSSLSALESDNVELINKLTSLQRSHSEVVDMIKHLELENESLKKEVLEKSEVIEHWIRARPLTSGSQKNENPLRKLLASTLAGDEQVNDLKDMNRKLQRMLEETLSKNIILQRDIQTLLERTEM